MGISTSGSSAWGDNYSSNWRQEPPQRGDFQPKPRGGENPFIQIGSPEDIVNLNPKTENVFDLLMGKMEGRGPSAPQTATNDAYLSLLAGKLPGFLSGVGERAAEHVGGMYSTGNALYSGAAQHNIAAGTTQAMNEALVPYLQTLGQNSLGFQQLQDSGDMNLLSMLSQFGTPEYFNPTYTDNPFFRTPEQSYAFGRQMKNDQLMDTLGPISAILSLIAPFLSMGGNK